MQATELPESSRILVMTTDLISFGMIIDEIKEILIVCNEEILPTPKGKEDSVTGIYEPQKGRNIMLLDVVNLVASQMKRLFAIELKDVQEIIEHDDLLSLP